MGVITETAKEVNSKQEARESLRGRGNGEKSQAGVKDKSIAGIRGNTLEPGSHSDEEGPPGVTAESANMSGVTDYESAKGEAIPRVTVMQAEQEVMEEVTGSAKESVRRMPSLLTVKNNQELLPSQPPSQSQGHLSQPSQPN